MSDFAFAAWFDAQTPKGVKVDFLGRLPKPFTFAPGGYAVIVENNGQPKQVFGENYPGWRRAQKKTELARTARRISVM